jgi:hypothetical protein
MVTQKWMSFVRTHSYEYHLPKIPQGSDKLTMRDDVLFPALEGERFELHASSFLHKVCNQKKAIFC